MRNNYAIQCQILKRFTIGLVLLNVFGCNQGQPAMADSALASVSVPSVAKMNQEFIVAYSKLGRTEKKISASYLVIPGTGCSGCITFAEQFLKDNIQSHKNLKFILTKINSVKLLKAKLGIDLRNPNLILDTLNQFGLGDLNSIYPTLYLFNQLGMLNKVSNSSDPEFDSLIRSTD